jgi:hypothetical protein
MEDITNICAPGAVRVVRAHSMGFPATDPPVFSSATALREWSTTNKPPTIWKASCNNKGVRSPPSAAVEPVRVPPVPNAMEDAHRSRSWSMSPRFRPGGMHEISSHSPVPCVAAAMQSLVKSDGLPIDLLRGNDEFLSSTLGLTLEDDIITNVVTAGPAFLEGSLRVGDQIVTMDDQVRLQNVGIRQQMVSPALPTRKYEQLFRVRPAETEDHNACKFLACLAYRLHKGCMHVLIIPSSLPPLLHFLTSQPATGGGLRFCYRYCQEN